MNRRASLAAAMLLWGCSAAAQPLPSYPDTRRDDAATKLGGVTVADPYRWLEGDVKTDGPVRDWVAAQEAITRHYLNALPERAAIHRTLEHIWDFEKLSAPRVRGDRQFFERNSGLQNQNVLYMQDNGKAPRVLLDPNALSAKGAMVVHDWQPTEVGDKLLYAIQVNGADRRQLHVIDVASGRDEDLAIEGVRTPTFTWAADGSGIYYARYPVAAGLGAPVAPTIFFHRLGTPQDADTAVFTTGDPALLIWPHATADGRWLAIEVAATDGTRGDVVVIDLAERVRTARPLVTGMKASWRFAGAAGGRLFFLTTAEASLGRVVSLDPALGTSQTPKQIAPQGNWPIQQAELAGASLVTRSLEGIQSRLHRYGQDGHDLGEVALPPLTVAGTLSGHVGADDLYYTLSSPVMPPTLYRLSVRTGVATRIAAPRASWRPSDYVVRQVIATSADGTKIPVTLAYHRLAGQNMTRPTVIMVYGGWGLSVDVGFYESRFAWMKMGGVFAIAHIRGGGEFGDRWHQAGIRANHVNGVADFVAAARMLQAQGVTTPAQTIAYGSSNGGMMSAAAVNAAPELFGVEIPRVPVTDLVRFPEFTSGRTWVSEIGDPSKPDELTGILRWSPLHNIEPGHRYPAALVSTADADDRVVPMHTFKYVAALQAANIGNRPHLLRIDRDAGHGEGKSTGQLIDEFTGIWSFAAHESGLTIPPGK